MTWALGGKENGVAISKATLGPAIKSVRMARGLTQEQLAAKVGMNKGSVALVEQGRRAVSLETLNNVANALNVPPACLAILGSTAIGKNKAATEFMESLQKLISAIVLAQAQFRAEEKGERSKRRTVEIESEQFHNLADLLTMYGTLAKGASQGAKQLHRTQGLPGTTGASRMTSRG